MSLRAKLFGAFLAFIILPLIVLGIAGYHLVTDLIERKYAEQSELTLRALSRSVGFAFGEMNKATDSAIASDAVQDALDDGEAASLDMDAIDYMELNEVQRNFREMLVSHPSVSYALMYTFHNERINTLFAKESFRAMPFDALEELPLYRTVLERAGLPVWVGPYEEPELTGTEPVFTQIRVVKDIDTLEDRGILLVQIKNAGLESVFRYFRYKQAKHATRFMIVSGEGLVLYDSDQGKGLSGRTLQEVAEIELPGDSSYRSGRLAFDGQDSVVSSIGLAIEDWRLVSVASWDSLASEIMTYAVGVAAFVLVCLASACLFILFFANRIARSVVRTVQFMRRVERGDLSARLPVEGTDEMALLARGFNRLVHRVSELLDEVKREQERKQQAELQALQAQIKPHFLFNALESINTLAIQNQGRQVSRMVARLGSLLRLSIDPRERVTVERELLHLYSYLEIQKFRFEDLFEFEIDVPHELMNAEMPKLTLQPLVENSIQHGFEGIGHMGRIRVSARREGGRLAFFVEDNGIGMAPGTLAAFECGRDAPPGRAESPETGERRGLGVRNVADRIRLGYGAPYGLFICSMPSGGTVIKLLLPLTAAEGTERAGDAS